MLFLSFVSAQSHYYDLDQDNIQDTVVLSKGVITVHFGNKTSGSFELPEITTLTNTKIGYTNPYEITIYYTGDKVLYGTITIFYKRDWYIKNVNFYNPCQECKDQNFKILTKNINLPIHSIDPEMLEIDSRGFKSLIFFDQKDILERYKDIKKIYMDLSYYPLLANSFNETTTSNFKKKFMLSQTNLDTVNNVAYILSENGNQKAAIDLLEQIIKKFPSRTVAYLNLADSYWLIGEKEKAVENYKTYLSLMKSQRKDLNKVPKYVGERIK
ncbi:hypothetical protein C1631_012970 [Chryseobacterium phosphatilyticum]|uniref:Uncharacterized protein n=2 Tax=Chryseobacterium phosphatilyticum TaxID=475075 RepID=A0A316X5P4_9FLAO|nr:hypothetical protein C1631_012970 [Chryseobacterium phosphatilyticum]